MARQFNSQGEKHERSHLRIHSEFSFLEAAGTFPKSARSGQVSRRLQNASTNWVDL